MLTALKTLWRAAALAGLIALAGFQSAGALTFDIGNASGTVGDTVTVVVTTDDLTGLGVYSYELNIGWSAGYASAVDALVGGTLTAPWGSVTFNPVAGQLHVAAAGATPLAGAGTLLELRFLLGPGAGNVTLSFTSAVLNEGSPVPTLTNGLLAITALPVVTVAPNSGEILVGDSLQCSSSGGSPPYTYSTSNPSVADFGGTAFLKGFSPGFVYVTSTDNNGISDMSNGPIYIRAIRLSGGTSAGNPGDTVSVDMTVTDTTPYNVTSAEFTVGYDINRLTPAGIDGAGTLASAAGWAAPAMGWTSSQLHVAMAGTTPLSGAGVLVRLKFVINPVTYSSNSALILSDGLFNETLPSVESNGYVYFSVAPTINVTPNAATIVAGDMLQFYVAGSVSPPLTWAVTNPSVASVDGTGKLTSTASGTTRVSATDNIGATDTTDTITICDFYLSLPTDTILIDTPSNVPVTPDRSVTGMGIYGFELTLTFDPAKVTPIGAVSVGTSSAAWGTPIVNTSIPGQIIIVHAGATPLVGSGPMVYVRLMAQLPLYGSSSPLTFTKVLFNEGDPCAVPVNGVLTLPTGAGSPPMPGSTLGQNIPNPFNPTTTIPYQVGAAGMVRIRIFAADGRLVRTLIERHHDAGGYRAVWDGTDVQGRQVSSGVYFCRMDAPGTVATRKMVLLK